MDIFFFAKLMDKYVHMPNIVEKLMVSFQQNKLQITCPMCAKITNNMPRVHYIDTCYWTIGQLFSTELCKYSFSIAFITFFFSKNLEVYRSSRVSIP